MLDLFGSTSSQRGQLSGITGHQIAVNNVPATRYEAGYAHYVGDKFRPQPIPAAPRVSVPAQHAAVTPADSTPSSDRANGMPPPWAEDSHDGA